MAIDFESKLDEITKHFTTELRKVKTELQSAKETLHLSTIHFNGEIQNLKTELKSSKETLELKTVHFEEELRKVKTELRSSKTSLDQLQRENARLKGNLENASKNQDYLMSEVKTLAQFSSKEPTFFDYTLRNKMNSTGLEIVKFDRSRAVSATKIYDESTGKVTIEEDGLYYFYAHGRPCDKSNKFILYIYVDDEIGCTAYKEDGTMAHMSCAIVRHLKRGQQIYVKKINKLFGTYFSVDGNYYPHTGFLGLKLH